MSDTLSKILIAIDGSEGSLRAAQFGAKLARGCGARITLLYVYNSSNVALAGLTAISGKEIDDAMRRVSSEHMEAAKKTIGDIEVGIEVRMGSPADEITSYAEQTGTDLIVMGSRGMSPMKQLLLGSVSSQVLHYAKCAVTVVH